ncbi:hypothetical protein VO64_0363 [Pseudomonas synxantha]|uniref:Mobile element protein n=1 Tax=Pseudomonas synxantha TaxID=47883 RepID=A0AAU8TFL2_9PSED|nr:hypothetical protein VO64_0363 [Pseudomonas synxantha]
MARNEMSRFESRQMELMQVYFHIGLRITYVKKSNYIDPEHL